MKHSLYQSDVAGKSPEELRRLFHSGLQRQDFARLDEALNLALRARDEDKLFRPRGLDAAHILLALKVDAITVEAALLSDPYLRETLEPASLRQQFGEPVSDLVEKVNWLNTFGEFSPEQMKQPEQAELIRRMLLAVVNDVRAVLIKLAYRLQRLRIMRDQDSDTRANIARETLDIFCPLANRLGIGQLKWEMEDLSFRYLHPDDYRTLAKSLATNRAERERYVRNFIELLETELRANHIKARVSGRPKHIYSIWKKMRRKETPLEELYDLHAVRVIVDELPTCYLVIGLVHNHWRHIPKEFDDYIANPKDNGYQSLHTVVVGPNDRPVEIQVRTPQMHEFAEYGVAAHWRYKEGGGRDAAFERSITSLRRLLESDEDDQSLLEDFRSDAFADQVFALTPKGQVIRLKKGATPLDFAYAIHTEVGHRCRGAKVDGRIVPLTYTLKSGEKVEILTAKQGGPSLGWLDTHLGYIKTAHARNKIRSWFRQQDHDKHFRVGKSILDRERHKLGLRDTDMDELARHFHLARADEVLLAIGRGDISPTQVATALKVPEIPGKAAAQVPRRVTTPKAAGEITVQGIRNLLTHIARCCTPEPGEPIIGYVTVGHSVAIHRQDCPNVLNLPHWKQLRLIDVAWGSEPAVYPMRIEVHAIDRKGLLKDVYQVLAQEHINIQRTDTATHPEDQSVVMHITLEIANLGQLSVALDKICEVHNVLSARRLDLEDQPPD
ncbi:MAG: bifunctional (p)ppGpp synthetase/guanosine-3',5'-bis(diphosphate) 3'-pyrophosphohydrolase [Methylotetracoccus sp.]|nr:bifunctional (p)ppGpp synthetase/guanosine-3',5'-bis(diphosphate) 3'-pyrophosphohydrolase [Methylotetracoccus sp.]